MWNDELTLSTTVIDMPFGKIKTNDDVSIYRDITLKPTQNGGYEFSGTPCRITTIHARDRVNVDDFVINHLIDKSFVNRFQRAYQIMVSFGMGEGDFYTLNLCAYEKTPNIIRRIYNWVSRYIITLPKWYQPQYMTSGTYLLGYGEKYVTEIDLDDVDNIAPLEKLPNYIIDVTRPYTND